MVQLSFNLRRTYILRRRKKKKRRRRRTCSPGLMSSVGEMAKD
jgi:hypothetical protein